MYTIKTEWFSGRKEATEEQVVERIKQVIEFAKGDLDPVEPGSHFKVEIKVTKSDMAQLRKP
jgi:hypothetical protein